MLQTGPAFKVTIELRSGQNLYRHFGTIEEANTEADEYESIGHDATVTPAFFYAPLP